MNLKTLYSALIIIFLSSCAATTDYTATTDHTVTTDYTVNLGDSTISQGELTIFHIENAPKSGDIEASFSGGEIFIVNGKDGTWGIIATDLQTKPGNYELSFKGGEKTVEAGLKIIDKDYGKESLNLPSGMVTLDSKDTDRVIKESALIRGIWSKSNKEPLWNGPFIMPLEGRLSAKFGIKRTMNNKPKSPHSGMDIAAPKGTPVLAANNGKVTFIGDFYFNGKFVIIDHGVGVFTLYAHLDEILIKKGDAVTKGNTIGKVGSTGRSTGPHLHFGVKVGTVRVSPKKLFEILGNS